MAAAVSSPSIIDLKAQATYPIRLGASITDPDNATRYASVKYNYRPALKLKGGADVTIEERGDEHTLVLEAEDGEYEYNGRYERQESSFVLVLRGDGKEREMLLERVDGSHGFNLVKTPKEDDALKLESEHPHLHAGDSDEDDLFGDADDEAPPDDSNPFDYRHFLKAELEKPETTQPVNDSFRSSAATPLIQHASTSTPVSRPAKASAKKAPAAKRKSAAADKPNPKRVKAGQDVPPPAAAPEPAKAKAKPVAPKIRVDRKASIRRPSIDDSGELILENETPVTEKPPRTAMAMALQGQLGAGPISLRSAASSPGVASPMPNKEEEVQEYEFEFGNSSSPEPEDAADQPSQDDGGEADLDGEDDDADVDDLELPSPATRHRPSVSAATVMGGDDEEDDMEKQLELAMAAEDNESEESEEE
ncbi:hypothetical protein HII31_10681 [Pseudocercospora fuligena]|uniref:Transcription elongation factor Eaf N-terminal domain-containing protein n=1 Tax=Pseudocercospora fuligena TaxID=685502 RepID=A0A8H6VH83_9PEZI|nr:hypothetical protein HII31_10681 [Pseudocercospora fuligena]